MSASASIPHTACKHMHADSLQLELSSVVRSTYSTWGQEFSSQYPCLRLATVCNSSSRGHSSVSGLWECLQAYMHIFTCTHYRMHRIRFYFILEKKIRTLATPPPFLFSFLLSLPGDCRHLCVKAGILILLYNHI